ncbi:MaoC/PaaZ C-terminal domain-containing protein [Tropicimonas isoalkanivorans]|uniref:Acyl dehydratase n=1 Tax=Tropicimonas isoalkanivorans TaxID=441112 RepID=A0A1I1HU87_9RHOB|nr:MaoC/PaaZ C-terminal domain-containing protein [Tropicimonas isoalkanivorans]SFC27494.1 Acyl dehydratase [Tropicimonas isoalkanivorans]
MAIDYEKLMSVQIPTIEQTYTEKDTMLYALGIGLGSDPVDPDQLRYVYEKGLVAAPSMAVVLAHPGLWIRDLDTGIDYVKVVHGEQGLTLHRPLPAAATVTGESRVTGIVDKGEGRGAMVYSERVIRDKATGEKLATITQNSFCRADGGYGGPSDPARKPHALPERAPDLSVDLTTIPQQALLYRLNADVNPLHADPEIARKAGFDRPILHGLATYGIACHALLKAVCGYDASRLRSLDGRFTAPVYPGETFRAEIWRDGDIASYRIRAVERDVVAISNGRAEIA